MKKEIIEYISKTIELVWKKDIKNDYNAESLVNEDTLKNAIYYHIRRRIGKLLEENNIKIFTEFRYGLFADMKYIPDIVLVEMDYSKEKEYIVKQAKRFVAIIEIKFQGDTYSATNRVYNDYEKMRKYSEKCDKRCLYYMATIWKARDNSAKPWIEDKEWKNGNLTELNASYNRNDNMKFSVIPHNKPSP